MTWTMEQARRSAPYKAQQERARRARLAEANQRRRMLSDMHLVESTTMPKIKMHVSAWYTDPLDGLQTRRITQVGN